MTNPSRKTVDDADRNWRRFVLFRVLFNSRFYYPVLAVLFLDLGLSATEYTVLNFAWALAIVFTDLPAGVLADRLDQTNSELHNAKRELAAEDITADIFPGDLDDTDTSPRMSR